MCQQVTDVDARLSQAQLAGRVLHVVPAARACAPAGATALADDVVNKIDLCLQKYNYLDQKPKKLSPPAFLNMSICFMILWPFPLGYGELL